MNGAIRRLHEKYWKLLRKGETKEARLTLQKLILLEKTQIFKQKRMRRFTKTA